MAEGEGYGTSSTLIGGRFLVGITGCFDNRVWIFDLQTRRGSEVGKSGDWQFGGFWVPLEVLKGILYILDGTPQCISLVALSARIEDGEVRASFARYAKQLCRPPPSFTRRGLNDYIPVCL